MAVLIHALLLAMTALAVDLNGRPVTELAPPGARAVVLFFAASDCPVSNRYIPEIERLTKQFEPLGVKVWFVYPNPGDNPNVVRAHDREYSITASTALDNTQSLTRMAQVTTTPEAAVFVPRNGALREVYRGRIDDRYVALGRQLPAPTTQDLRLALDAVLDHQTPKPPAGPPVGCLIILPHKT